MSSGATSRVLSAASLTSSFQYIASERHSEATTSSEESFESISDATSSEDDEIVWSVSDSLSASVLSAPSATHDLRSPDIFSDEEFIVLSPPSVPRSNARAPASGGSSLSASFVGSGIDISSIDGLSDVMSNLNIESDAESVAGASQTTSRRPRRRHGGRARAAVASPSIAPAPQPVTPKAKKNKGKTEQTSSPAVMPRKTRSKRAKPASPSAAAPHQVTEGLGDRPIVDDMSEAGDARLVTVYDEASQYISSFLAETTNEPKTKSNLPFLQALIVELGLLPTQASTAPTSQSFFQLPSLPKSLKAAKAILKSNVFLNVRDYLDVREKGLDALRKVMHPTRKALIRDLTRGKGKRKVPRDVIKKSGLGVLLVTCYH